MPQPKPSWMDEEENRAEDLKQKGQTANHNAPILQRVTRAPSRKQKAFYIQDQHAEAFETLVFKQKMEKGKKAPELAEEAIEMLLAKYDEKL